MKLNGRRGVQDEKRLILEHKLLAQPSYSFLSVDSCSLYGHYWKCELIQFWIKNSDWNPIRCLRSSILDLFSHLVINPVSNLSQRHRLLKRQASLLSRISSGRRPFKRSLPLLLFFPPTVLHTFNIIQEHSFSVDTIHSCADDIIRLSGKL